MVMIMPLDGVTKNYWILKKKKKYRLQTDEIWKHYAQWNCLDTKNRVMYDLFRQNQRDRY